MNPDPFDLRAASGRARYAPLRTLPLAMVPASATRLLQILSGPSWHDVDLFVTDEAAWAEARRRAKVQPHLTFRVLERL